MDSSNNISDNNNKDVESPDSYLKRLRETIESIEVDTTLAELNPHERDGSVLFEKGEHKYSIVGDSDVYISTTTWNSAHFTEVNEDEIIAKMMRGKKWKAGHAYWGMTIDEIKANWKFKRDSACLLGECMHKLIEHFLNRRSTISHSESNIPICGVVQVRVLTTHEMLMKRSMIDDPFEYRIARAVGLHIEWNYFMQYIIAYPMMIPYRTEWRIYHDELKICGTIDVVYQDPDDGTLSIGDWKRVLQLKWIEPIVPFRSFSKVPGLEHIPDLNYWHYVLQLNVYKLILEQKYNKTVKALYLMKFHANAPSYEIFQLPILHTEMDILICNRLNQLKQNGSQGGNK